MDLLYMRTLEKDVPPRVAGAVLRILIKEGILGVKAGHTDVVGRPGITLAYPPDAATELRREVMKRVKPGAPLWILARVMQRSGVTGTGGLSPGRSGSPGMMPARSPPRDQGKKLGEELDRLRWSAPELVDSFGAHSRSEAKILVSYLIKRDELRLARVDPGLAAPDTGSRDSALTGSGPPEIKRIADRLRDGSSLRKAKHACLRLLETQGEWIPGSQLKLLGIPLTSARYHFKTARPGDGLVGGGSTPLQFRRTTLIEYVADHWTPRCAPKRRFKDLRSGGVTDLA